MTYENELRRRKFMQTCGRYLSWGFENAERMTKADAGVLFTAEDWARFYQRFECFERYADHGGDREAAERAVIDKAIAAYDAIGTEIPINCEVK